MRSAQVKSPRTVTCGCPRDAAGQCCRGCSNTVRRRRSEQETSDGTGCLVLCRMATVHVILGEPEQLANLNVCVRVGGKIKQNGITIAPPLMCSLEKVKIQCSQASIVL